MRKLLTAYGNHVFFLLVAADLAGIVSEYEPLHIYSKPLLMPVLIVLLATATPPFRDKILLLTGLFFSFAGDVFLLFDSKYPLCFILGLASFLVTHLLYIAYFLRLRPTGISLFKRKPFLLLIIILYVGGLLALLIPHLGALIVPVILYAMVLGAMLISSLHVFFRSAKKAATLFVAGAVCFVLSDSLLAINKFYVPLPSAGFFIMLTYCAAQFLIVQAARQRSKVQHHL